MPEPLHEWAVTPAEAVALQKALASQLIADRPLDIDAIRYVAGVDVSVKDTPGGVAMSQAAVAVLAFPSLRLVEAARAVLPTPFPYIPGLLSFREGAVILKAHELLTLQPDVYIFDGMGRAHPRRIGIASHIGLWLNKPTIGCGKTHLTGRYTDPPHERGAWSPLTDRDELIGAVLRTRPNTKPVYISVGHLASLPTALDLVMRCTGKYRLPEPIRAAHHAAGEFSPVDEVRDADQPPLC
ncbi:MAG: deoxyribonuclease V [bacterium]|nr:deoxyribonuclease V [bacterium]